VASVDVMDETFLVVDRAELAARFADPRTWGELWPDLELRVFTDRGDAGIRWSVTGEWVGSMEVWLEPVLDGTVLHQFLRLDPAGGPLPSREGTREAQRRQLAAKRIAFALKAELERGRRPGEPRVPRSATVVVGAPPPAMPGTVPAAPQGGPADTAARGGAAGPGTGAAGEG